MLTEREAWFVVAGECWLAKASSDGEYYTEFGWGLCSILRGLWLRDDIDARMYYQMNKAIPPRGANDFVWPTNLEGMKARIEFCLERANELT